MKKEILKFYSQKQGKNFSSTNSMVSQNYFNQSAIAPSIKFLPFKVSNSLLPTVKK